MINPTTKKSGIFVVDKPEGPSSFSYLGRIKRVLDIRKVGHAGTLDPFARGVLIVMTGFATRLAFLFEELDKEYLATLRFGTLTDTLDPEGSTTRTGPIPSEEDIIHSLKNHTGEIDQVPPAYSAIHVDGKRS